MTISASLSKISFVENFVEPAIETSLTSPSSCSHPFFKSPNLKNAVFAPGQSRICMLDYAKIGKEITFTLEYHSGAKKKYSEKFTIDLKAGVSMPYGKTATEGKELRQSLILCKRCYRKIFELKVKKRRASCPNHHRDSWLCVNLPYAFSHAMLL